MQHQGPAEAWRRGPIGPGPGHGILLDPGRAKRREESARQVELLKSCGGRRLVAFELHDGSPGGLDDILALTFDNGVTLEIRSSVAQSTPRGILQVMAQDGAAQP